MEDPSTPDEEDFQLFHESLREWLRKKYQRECEAMQQTLAERCNSWQEFTGSARRYALAFGAQHLDDTSDKDHLYNILMDEKYRTAQKDTFKHYGVTLNSLKIGLDHYIRRDGETPEDDGRLAALALLCGEEGHRAKTDIKIAFDWAKDRPLDDPNRIPDALKRLEILDEKEFFKAVILLLWIEADRRRDEGWDDTIPESVNKVLEAADKKIPEGSGTVDWHKFLDAEFMAFWTWRVIGAFPLEKDTLFLNFLGHVQEEYKWENLIALLCKKTTADTPLRSYRVLNFALVVIDRIRDYFDDPEKRKVEALVSIAQAFMEMNNSDFAEKVFTRALDIAFEIETDSYRSSKFKTLEFIAKALYQSQLTDRAEIVFLYAVRAASMIETDWIKAEALGEVAQTLRALGETDWSDRVFASAFEIASKLTDIQTSSNVLLSVTIPCLTKKEELDLAIEATSNKSNDSDKSKYIILIVKTLLAVEDIQGFTGIFMHLLDVTSSIKEDSSKSEALVSIVKALLDSGEMQVFTDNIERFLNIALGIRNEMDKVDTLSSIANALTKVENMYERSKVFTRLLELVSEFVVDFAKVEGFSSIAKALFEVRDIECSKEVFESALEVASGISKFSGKDEAFGMIAKSLSEVGEFMRALEVGTNIDHEYHKLEAIDSIAKALSDARNIQGFAYFFSRLLEVSLEVKDKRAKAATLDLIIKAFSHTRSIRKSIALFSLSMEVASETDNESAKDEALARIGEAFSKDVKLSLALKVGLHIRDEFQKAEILGIIALALSKNGDLQQSFSIFDRFFNVASGILDEFQKANVIGSMAISLSHVMIKQGLSDLFPLFIEVEAEIETSFNKSFLISLLSEALSDAGDIQGVTNLFARLLELTSGIRDEFYKPKALGSIAESLTKVVNMHERSNLFSRLLVLTSEIRNESDKAVALGLIADSFAKVKNIHERIILFTRLLELMSEFIVDDFARVKGFNSIAKALFEVGETEWAKEVFETALKIVDGLGEYSDFTMIANSPSEFGYSYLTLIANSLLEVGEYNWSKDVLTRALDVASEIRKDWMKTESLASIARILAKTGAIDLSRQVFTRAVEIAFGSGIGETKADTLARVSQNLLEAGEIDWAIQVLFSALDESPLILWSEEPHDFPFKSIISILSENGYLFKLSSVFSYAYKIASGIESVFYKAKALTSIVEVISEISCVREHPISFSRLLNVASEISIDSKKSEALYIILIYFGFKNEPFLFENFLSTALWTNPVWEKTIPTWQQALLNTDQAYLPFLRRSLGYYAFHREIAYGGVFRFLSGLYKTGKIDEAETVIRYCPQLEMDFLLPEPEHDGRNYANLDEWLDDLEDEDTQGKIAVWAHRVGSGRMTEEDFNMKTIKVLCD